LNHHEFASRAISLEERDNLAEITDGNEEPSEETDTGDADFLSEAEGDEIDQPRRRFDACFVATQVLCNSAHLSFSCDFLSGLFCICKCSYKHFLIIS